jgi:hypothetical protein
MDASTVAVLAILSVALAVWAVAVARDPKTWRMRWMDLFGVLDVDTTREVRRVQEAHVRFLSLTLCMIFVVSFLSCAFWTLDSLREEMREKSPMERDQAFLRKHIESKSNR